MRKWIGGVAVLASVVVGCTGGSGSEADADAWPVVEVAQSGAELRCPPPALSSDGESDLEEYGRGVPREQLDPDALLAAVRVHIAERPATAPIRSADLEVMVPAGRDQITDVEVGAWWPDHPDYLGALYTVSHTSGEDWSVTYDVACSSFISPPDE